MGAASGLGWVIWRENNSAEKEWGFFWEWRSNCIRLSTFVCIYACWSIVHSFVFYVCRWYRPVCLAEWAHIQKHFLKFFLIPCTFHTFFFLCGMWIQVHIIHDIFSFYSQHFWKKAFGLLQSFHTGREWWSDSNFINIFCCCGCVKPSLQKLAFSITTWQLLSEVWTHPLIFFLTLQSSVS